MRFSAISMRTRVPLFMLSGSFLPSFVISLSLLFFPFSFSHYFFLFLSLTDRFFTSSLLFLSHMPQLSFFLPLSTPFTLTQAKLSTYMVYTQQFTTHIIHSLTFPINPIKCILQIYKTHIHSYASLVLSRLSADLHTHSLLIINKIPSHSTNSIF